jgi:hypothetical protein
LVVSKNVNCRGQQPTTKDQRRFLGPFSRQNSL